MKVTKLRKDGTRKVQLHTTERALLRAGLDYLEASGQSIGLEDDRMLRTLITGTAKESESPKLTEKQLAVLKDKFAEISSMTESMIDQKGLVSGKAAEIKMI